MTSSGEILYSIYYMVLVLKDCPVSEQYQHPHLGGLLVRAAAMRRSGVS